VPFDRLRALSKRSASKGLAAAGYWASRSIQLRYGRKLFWNRLFSGVSNVSANSGQKRTRPLSRAFSGLRQAIVESWICRTPIRFRRSRSQRSRGCRISGRLCLAGEAVLAAALISVRRIRSMSALGEIEQTADSKKSPGRRAPGRCAEKSSQVLPRRTRSSREIV
jgi:hypothetical protein